MTLRGQLLKRLNLAFPLSSVDSLDLSRFFQFKVLDRDRLEKHLLWCNRKQIVELDKRKSGYGNLMRQMINSGLRGLMTNAYSGNEYLMDINEKFRSGEFGLSNYSRFFTPIDEFNMEFCKQVSSQSFLKSGYKGQIGA